MTRQAVIDRVNHVATSAFLGAQAGYPASSDDVTALMTQIFDELDDVIVTLEQQEAHGPPHKPSDQADGARGDDT